MMPWKLLGTYSSYIIGWLVGYSGLLGPVAGIMIADYFSSCAAVCTSTICTAAAGSMSIAMASILAADRSLAAGILVALIGLVVPPVRWLYDYAWFVGFAVSALSTFPSHPGPKERPVSNA